MSSRCKEKGSWSKLRGFVEFEKERGIQETLISSPYMRGDPQNSSQSSFFNHSKERTMNSKLVDVLKYGNIYQMVMMNLNILVFYKYDTLQYHLMKKNNVFLYEDKQLLNLKKFPCLITSILIFEWVSYYFTGIYEYSNMYEYSIKIKTNGVE